MTVRATWVPPRTDPSSRYFEAFYETMPRADLEQLQADRLGALIPYVYERSAMVRSLWDAAGVTPDDVCDAAAFRALAPLFGKEDLRRYRAEKHDPFGGLLCVEPHELKVLGSSSGTTGDPSPIPQQPLGPLVRGMSRDQWEAGVRPGDRVAFTTFTARSAHAIERFEQIGAIPIFLDTAGDEALLLDVVRRFEAKCIYVLNNISIARIEEVADEAAIDPKEAFASVDDVMFGGEPMSERSKRLLAEWHVRVHNMTTLGDVTIAAECRAADGCHAWEDLVLVEQLEPGGTEAIADGGRGELVVTSLTEWAAPLVRYRSGDLIELRRDTCACGRTHGRFEILGRVQDEVVIAGRSIVPADLWAPIEAVPATSDALFQIIRTARAADRLRLRVGCRSSTAMSLVAADVADSVRSVLGIEADVEVVPSADLLRLGPVHKIPRVSAT
jgi:phenylacetate-CoA ligase